MESESNRCEGCRGASELFPFTMAFQPVVDIKQNRVYAHEALVRGPNGEGAYSVLSRVGPENRYAFDQACRVKAIELAAKLGMQTKLSINFLPNAVYRAEACIRLTLETAKRVSFPVGNIIFELTEDERSRDLPHLYSIFTEYRRQGFITALDDFGAGYAGLEFLATFQADVVKLDMSLIRGIEASRVKAVLVSGMVDICRKLGISVVAEGVETKEEFVALRDMGIELFQGYLFARPGLECMPSINWEPTL